MRCISNRIIHSPPAAVDVSIQNIADVSQDCLCQAIEIEHQVSSRLHWSLSNNFLNGNLSVSDTQAVAALKQVEAYEFIPNIKDSQGRTSLGGHVGKHVVKLSGGQRQNIKIAQVFLKSGQFCCGVRQL